MRSTIARSGPPDELSTAFAATYKPCVQKKLAILMKRQTLLAGERFLSIFTFQKLVAKKYFAMKMFWLAGIFQTNLLPASATEGRHHRTATHAARGCCPKHHLFQYVALSNHHIQNSLGIDPTSFAWSWVARKAIF